MLNFEQIIKDKKTFLVTGESGSGKSTFVRDLHERYLSQRPLVTLNIAAISENLFESELFGHKKGAFTGAIETKMGHVERAADGILFLDEVGDLSLALQVKLLQLIEERVFHSVGCGIVKNVRATLIFATNKNLLDLVKKNQFREDLYYRLCGLNHQLLPLRSNRNEVLSKLNEYRFRLDKESFQYLVNQYPWPGNYRELGHVIDKITYSKMSSLIGLSDLGIEKEVHSPIEEIDDYYMALEQFERIFLSTKMHEFKGRVNYASEKIGLSKSTLIAKLRKYGINSMQIRASSQEMSAA